MIIAFALFLIYSDICKNSTNKNGGGAIVSGLLPSGFTIAIQRSATQQIYDLGLIRFTIAIQRSAAQ